MRAFAIEKQALPTEIGNQLRKSLEERFVGIENSSARNICNYVEGFLRSNNISLIPVVHIMWPRIDIRFIGLE